MINWKVSKEDAALIDSIARRAQAVSKACAEMDILDLCMDITACHNNGCPLDLAKLLSFPCLDFLHDVLGIYRHINRKTGKLENCFIPRCAK